MPETGPAVDKSFKTELLIAVDEELKAEEMRNLSQLIDEYNDVFSQWEYDLGCTNLVMHGIGTGRSGNRCEDILHRTPKLFGNKRLRCYGRT